MRYRTRADDMPLPVALTMLALMASIVVGWVWNIVKIVSTVADPLSAMFVLRCVGVFIAPLGAVLGFL